MNHVYLYGKYDYDRYNNYDPVDQDEHASAIGINPKWDLFSGGERSAVIRKTDAGLRLLQRQREQKILEIQAALQQALVEADSSRTVYLRESYTLTLVREIRDHVERSYRAGATTLTRLNEAQTDLVTVSAAVATSRINYLQQLTNLQAASGRILEGM
ncbi:MAG: TolC family protein [Desulfobulbus sp.]